MVYKANFLKILLEQYPDENEDYGYDDNYGNYAAKYDENFEDEEEDYYGKKTQDVVYVKKEPVERKPIGFTRSIIY